MSRVTVIERDARGLVTIELRAYRPRVDGSSRTEQDLALASALAEVMLKKGVRR